MAPPKPAMGSLPPFRHRTDIHCHKVDPDLFYDGDLSAAKALCKKCPARDECLEWALDNDVAHGTWAGLTAPERKALRRTMDRERAGVTTAPVRPERLPVQWGWVQGKLVDRDMLRRTFAAAAEYVTEGGHIRKVAARHRVNQGRVADTAIIVRNAPDLVADVVGGWLPFGVALRHARDVRDWQARRPDAA